MELCKDFPAHIDLSAFFVSCSDNGQPALHGPPRKHGLAYYAL